VQGVHIDALPKVQLPGMLNNDDLVDIIHKLDGRLISKFAGGNTGN
jgi:hypothetical protein